MIEPGHSICAGEIQNTLVEQIAMPSEVSEEVTLTSETRAHVCHDFLFSA